MGKFIEGDVVTVKYGAIDVGDQLIGSVWGCEVLIEEVLKYGEYFISYKVNGVKYSSIVNGKWLELSYRLSDEVHSVGDRVRVLSGAQRLATGGWVNPVYHGLVCRISSERESDGSYLVIADSVEDKNNVGYSGQHVHEKWLEKVEVFKVKVGQKYKTVGDWGACHEVVTVTSIVDDVVFLKRKTDVGSGSEGHANVDTFFSNDKAYELHAGKDSPLCYVLIKDVDPVSNRLDDLEERAKKLGPSMESDVDRLVRASVWLGLDWSRVDIERVVGLAGDLK